MAKERLLLLRHTFTSPGRRSHLLMGVKSPLIGNRASNWQQCIPSVRANFSSKIQSEIRQSTSAIKSSYIPPVSVDQFKILHKETKGHNLVYAASMHDRFYHLKYFVNHHLYRSVKECLATQLAGMLAGPKHVPQAWVGYDSKKDKHLLITETCSDYLDASHFDRTEPFFVNKEGITSVRLDEDKQNYQVYGRILLKYIMVTLNQIDPNFLENCGIFRSQPKLHTNGSSLYPLFAIDWELALPDSNQKSDMKCEGDLNVIYYPEAVAQGIVTCHLREKNEHILSLESPIHSVYEMFDQEKLDIKNRITAREEVLRRFYERFTINNVLR